LQNFRERSKSMETTGRRRNWQCLEVQKSYIKQDLNLGTTIDMQNSLDVSGARKPRGRQITQPDPMNSNNETLRTQPF
jgi:hypothetical protein